MQFKVYRRMGKERSATRTHLIACRLAQVLNGPMAIPDRTHIFGASGSGTSPLGTAMAQRFGHLHLDVDSFFWEKTDPPFTMIREVAVRQQMLGEVLDSHRHWVLSGSLCGWGDIFIPRFELAIFLYIPHALRMRRIIARERKRYGDAINEGGAMRSHHLEFIEWARKYDTVDESMRSLRLHQRWIATLPCRCLRLDGDLTTDERIDRIAHLTG